MKTKLAVSALFAVGISVLSGCSNNAGTGAVIGSLIGAGIGKSTANHSDKRVAIGAALGGIVGSAIGSEKDRRAGQAYNATTEYPETSSTEEYAYTQPEYVYVDRPYPVRSTVVIRSGGYYGRRHNSYRNRHHYRNRHNYRHYPRHHRYWR